MSTIAGWFSLGWNWGLRGKDGRRAAIRQTRITAPSDDITKKELEKSGRTDDEAIFCESQNQRDADRIDPGMS
jgi:hypothetical protein